MFSETATELVKSNDPAMFYIAIGLLAAMYILIVFRKVFCKL